MGRKLVSEERFCDRWCGTLTSVDTCECGPWAAARRELGGRAARAWVVRGRSGVGVGVVAGAVPGHAGGGARAARGAAQRRAARAHHRLLRLHARRPRAQPLQQGRRRARQRPAHDAQGLDLLLLRGTRRHKLCTQCFLEPAQKRDDGGRNVRDVHLLPLSFGCTLPVHTARRRVVWYYIKRVEPYNLNDKLTPMTSCPPMFPVCSDSLMCIM